MTLSWLEPIIRDNVPATRISEKTPHVPPAAAYGDPLLPGAGLKPPLLRLNIYEQAIYMCSMWQRPFSWPLMLIIENFHLPVQASHHL